LVHNQNTFPGVINTEMQITHCGFITTAILATGILITCSSGLNGSAKSAAIDTAGLTIAARFAAPDSFFRPKWPANSFAAYLSEFPLLPNGTPVKLYNGELKKRQSVAAAVLDIDVGTKDLQQCADAVMRLRAEYLYQQKKYTAIQFHFTNGFNAAYSKWANGYRIKVQGNHAAWYKYTGKDFSKTTFRQYLDMVFSYAGSLSLSKELQSKKIDSIMPGDVLIIGGSPGHAITVVDVALHKTTGKRIFLLAQSYMPAQNIHVLTNPKDHAMSPWYAIPADGKILTPEWNFTSAQLKSFPATH
jgi:hypothetical protein